MAMGLWSGQNSTYICPLVLGETKKIPIMQWGSLAIDAFLAITAYELSLPHSSSSSRGHGPMIWSTVVVVS